MKQIKAYREQNLHPKRHQNLDQNVLSRDGWDRFGVIWAKNPKSGFDLLVPATNNRPARPDCQRRRI